MFKAPPLLQSHLGLVLSTVFLSSESHEVALSGAQIGSVSGEAAAAQAGVLRGQEIECYITRQSRTVATGQSQTSCIPQRGSKTRGQERYHMGASLTPEQITPDRLTVLKAPSLGWVWLDD